MKFLADTNALSEAVRLAPSHAVNRWFRRHRDETSLSAITLAEIRRGIELKEPGRRRTELERFLADLVADYEDVIYPFDRGAAEAWGRMVADHERRGRPLGRHDSQIAAIALYRELTVVTRNTSDFPGVTTVNPWAS